MQLERHHMQTLGPLRVVTPRLPERQKIVPQAKPRFADGKCVLPLPARGQLVTAKEHASGLFQRTPGGVINIAKIFADGDAVLVKRQSRRNQRLIVAGHTIRLKNKVPSRTMIRDGAILPVLTKALQY